MEAKAEDIKVYVNHIGFELWDNKTAVLALRKQPKEITAWAEASDGCLYPAAVSGLDRIEDWWEGCCCELDLSAIDRVGDYRIKGKADGAEFSSERFYVHEYFLNLRMVNASRVYFKGERSSGEWLKADYAVPFGGEREGCRDLHGGWYDATGDFGIHLTQLSHTAVFNPLQSLLPSYVCFDIADRMESKELRDCRILRRELLDEAYWGADLCMRLYQKGSSFIRSVDRGDAFSEELHRSIDLEYFHHSGHEEDKSYLEEKTGNNNYETGFRSGAGLAIAVLAQAAGHNGASGSYKIPEYLSTAEEAFAYMMEHNEEYVSDGSWNFLDCYCALMAAQELYRVTEKEEYICCCRRLVERTEAYAVNMESGIWFLAGKEEMYFHPSDEGLPLLALTKYCELEKEKSCRQRALHILNGAFTHLLAISNKPFGYAAFTWKKAQKEENRYFFPHDTAAAPWWQGENARIASLAAAALRYVEYDRQEGCAEAGLRDKLEKFAQHQLDWIMGCNPFDSCMIDGFGRNNIQYFFQGKYDFLNSPGGICNGITARESDDKGLEFIMAPTDSCDDNWRWAEQWLPHVCWYLYAMGQKLK